MSTEMHPVFVDGPLAGQDFATTSHTVFAMEPVEIEPDRWPPSIFAEQRQVAYMIRRYVILGRVVYIGTCKPYGTDPSDEELFEHLISAAGKAAVADGQVHTS